MAAPTKERGRELIEHEELVEDSVLADEPELVAEPKSRSGPVHKREAAGVRRLPDHGNGTPGRTRRQPPIDNHKRLVKASFNLPADELEALKELASRRQTTATQVLREALMTERTIQELVDSGAKFVAKVGRRSHELVFSHMRLGG